MAGGRFDPAEFIRRTFDERIGRAARAFRGAIKSAIDAAWTSGNPKTKRPTDVTTPNITQPINASYALKAMAASDTITELKVAERHVINGAIANVGDAGLITAASLSWVTTFWATPGNTNTLLSANTERSKTGVGADAFSDVKRFYLANPGRYRVSLELARSAATTVQAKVQLELSDGTRRDVTTTASSTTNHPSFSSHNLDMTETANHAGMFLVVQYKNDNTAQTAYIRNVAVKYDVATTVPALLSVVITD